jgi:hypothetical protein
MTIHARPETDSENEIIAAKSQAYKTNKMQQKYLKQKQKKNADYSTILQESRPCYITVQKSIM